MKKCKIFDFGKFKVMLIGNNSGTEMYMQINSSNWSFCVSDFEPFDEWDNEECVKAIADTYFSNVNREEEALGEFLKKEMLKLLKKF